MFSLFWIVFLLKIERLSGKVNVFENLFSHKNPGGVKAGFPKLERGLVAGKRVGTADSGTVMDGGDAGGIARRCPNSLGVFSNPTVHSATRLSAAHGNRFLPGLLAGEALQ